MSLVYLLYWNFTMMLMITGAILNVVRPLLWWLHWYFSMISVLCLLYPHVTDATALLDVSIFHWGYCSACYTEILLWCHWSARYTEISLISLVCLLHWNFTLMSLVCLLHWNFTVMSLVCLLYWNFADVITLLTAVKWHTMSLFWLLLIFETEILLY